MFKSKKYRRVVFEETEYWCKIGKINDLCFQKWHEVLEIFTRALESHQIGTLMVFFYLR